MLTTGLILGAVGVGLTAGGAGAYVSELHQQQQEEARCRDPNGHQLCFFTELDTVPGGVLLGIGVAHLVSALIVTMVGVADNDRH